VTERLVKIRKKSAASVSATTSASGSPAKPRATPTKPRATPIKPRATPKGGRKRKAWEVEGEDDDEEVGLDVPGLKKEVNGLDIHGNGFGGDDGGKRVRRAASLKAESYTSGAEDESEGDEMGSVFADEA